MRISLTGLVITIGVVAVTAFTGGCGAFAGKPPQDKTTKLIESTYPGEAAVGRDLHMVVRRDRNELVVTNLTARSYSDMYLWLNQSYVGYAERIEIGTGNRYSLRWFFNEHAQSYPRGAFLQPDKSFPIVLAELFDPTTGHRHRLFVQKGRQ